MSKTDSIRLPGVITEVLGNSMFRVKLENGHQIVAHIGGKLRVHSIRLVLGDKVDVEMSVYDATKGRIVFRK